MKGRIDKLEFIILKIFVQWKTMSREWKDEPHNGRKRLQKIDPKKNCHPKNYWNTTVRKQTTQLKNGQKIWRDT